MILGLSKVSEQTFDRLDSRLLIIPIFLHFLFWGLNTYFEYSESTWLRLLAIAVFLPFPLMNVFPVALQQTLKKLFFVSLSVTGPGFLIGTLLLELGQAEPDQLVIVRRQYQILATFLAVVLLCDRSWQGAILCTLTCVLMLVTLIPLFQPQFELLSESWFATTSLYVMFVILIVVIDNRKQRQREGMVETMVLLSSSFAHEIRTPLLTIEARVMSIDQKSDPTREFVTESLMHIKSEIDSVKTMLEMFRLNSKQSLSNSENEVFSVSEAIMESVARYPYRSECERNSVELTLNSYASVLGPRLFFVHVFFNLLKNAFNNRSENRPVRVNISISVHGPYVQIAVTDNGRGISPTETHRVFEPFYSNSTQHGNGVGLTFSKMVIEQGFAGRLTCKSDLDNFTTFNICLPINNPAKR